MASLQLPPAARLFMELLAARLEIKVLQREIDELRAQLAKRDTPDEI
jgi:hypothetical protein